MVRLDQIRQSNETYVIGKYTGRCNTTFDTLTIIVAFCELNADGIREAFALHNLTVIQNIAFPEADMMADEMADDYLYVLKTSVRSRSLF